MMTGYNISDKSYLLLPTRKNVSIPVVRKMGTLSI